MVEKKKKKKKKRRSEVRGLEVFINSGRVFVCAGTERFDSAKALYWARIKQARRHDVNVKGRLSTSNRDGVA